MDLRVKWLFFRFREGSTAVGEPLPESLLRKSPKKSKLGKSESATDSQESAEKSRYLLLALFDFPIIFVWWDVVRTKDPHHRRVMSKNSD